jgi:hypothetical protein
MLVARKGRKMSANRSSSHKVNRVPWIVVGALGCLALCLIVVLSTGAFYALSHSNNAPTAPSAANVAPPTPGAATSPTTPSTNAAALSLGSIKFTADAAKKQSVAFAADGKDASLSVTDAAGYVWTLTIPKDALLSPRTITLTPFASVDSSQAALPVKSGVLMEPDGLQFTDAATLTVTPPASMTRKGVMIIAGQDGSQVEFAETTQNGSTYSAPIWHFSSGGWGDPPDDKLSQLEQQAFAQYQQAEAELKALERVVEQPPVPPDLELKCQDQDNDAAEQQADAYTDQFFARERPVVQRLLGAARTLALLGADPGDNGLALVAELFETRVKRRVDTLFADYSGDPKKLFAVAKVALAAERQYALLGGSTPTGWLPQITDWARRARDYYLDKLRKEHDYSVFPQVLIAVERTVVLLTGHDDSGDFIQKMLDAMTFKLTLDGRYQWSVSGKEQSKGNVVTHGEVTLHADPGAVALRGQGSFNYLSSSMTMNGESGTVVGAPFPVVVELQNFDACHAMTVDILMDRFGGNETFDLAGNGGETRGSGPLLDGFAQVAFVDKIDPQTGFFKIGDDLRFGHYAPAIAGARYVFGLGSDRF